MHRVTVDDALIGNDVVVDRVEGGDDAAFPAALGALGAADAEVHAALDLGPLARRSAEPLGLRLAVGQRPPDPLDRGVVSALHREDAVRDGASRFDAQHLLGEIVERLRPALRRAFRHPGRLGVEDCVALGRLEPRPAERVGEGHFGEGAEERAAVRLLDREVDHQPLERRNLLDHAARPVLFANRRAHQDFERAADPEFDPGLRNGEAGRSEPTLHGLGAAPGREHALARGVEVT